jgi:large subunit ribosomal protein L23
MACLSLSMSAKVSARLAPISSVAFPNKITQVEIKSFLERVHGLSVESVRTLNYEGKKKRSKQGYYRRPDYKKVYVTLKEPQQA